MANLRSNPSVVRLAHDLGLDSRGDCLKAVITHALTQVEDAITQSPICIGDLRTLGTFLADRLSVTIRHLDSDTDIERIAKEYATAIPRLRAQLQIDFVDGESEGLLLALCNREPWQHRYLAIIDRRGEQVNRAWFTTWHELAHLLTSPPQYTLAGFRRSPTRAEIAKDPIEQVTDSIAGLIAFYDPLFRPVFDEIIGTAAVTFRGIETTRVTAAPDASFQSTAMACVRLSSLPAALLKIEPRLTAKERRAHNSPQFAVEVAANAEPTPKIRVALCYLNDAASRAGIKIFKQMRVPPKSVLTRVYEGMSEEEEWQLEDQSWWETTTSGPLTRLPLIVRAIRRGTHVYGLVTPLA